MKKKKPAVRPAKKQIDSYCSFCKSKASPKWQDYEKLGNYLSVRGRILSSSYSGVCVKHQRKLAKAVKQARHLALLPFTAAV
ncbi:MAG: 30S ribosomal protein S18 [Candidatus Shapirobacteria bacterium]|jgi:small subunit ribosomal protein S18